jgi:hypothetical protein
MIAARLIGVEQLRTLPGQAWRSIAVMASSVRDSAAPLFLREAAHERVRQQHRVALAAAQRRDVDHDLGQR